YYQEIWADPHHEGTVYQANVRLGRTEDGGSTWGSVSKGTKHVDNHAVAFHPQDPDFLLVGCDGGLYVSYDRGENYRYFETLPLTQFYKLDVDNDWPVYHIVGGTQDNNTQYGPSRNLNSQGIRNSDWRIVLGGDGHDNAIDPTNPDIIYGESQQGFIRRFDRRSGESIDIRPQPGPGEDYFRFNWDSPILISPHDPSRIYFGSNFLHRSDDRGDSWTTISPDMSHQRDRLAMPMMDRVWGLDAVWDVYAMSMYGNITSISESPLVQGLLYVGTDDGRVHVSENGGDSWRAVEKIGDLPPSAFINDVKADLHDADTVYLCLDNHKEGDYNPYLMRSTDRGRTWESMASDLPERHLVWRIVQDHVKPELFFLGTEFGIFTTLDAGEHWLEMKGGLPTIPFRYLAIQQRENDLVGASFGRSFYILDDYAPMREIDEAFVQEEMHILPVRDSLLYRPTNMLGGRHGSQGDSHYSSDNPEFGAVIRYYLRDGLKSLEAQRAEGDKELAKEGGDTPYPGWDTLRAEQEEEGPQMILEIHDARGGLVRRLEASSGKGMQSVTWDLRHSGNATGSGGRGPLALAGTYHVTAKRLQGGVSTPWGNSQSITLADLLHPELDHVDRAAAMAWQEEVGRRQNVVGGSLRVLDEALGDVAAMKDAVRGGRATDLGLADRLRAMEVELQRQRRAIAGDDLRTRHGHEGAPNIQSRLRGARWGGFGYANNPTTTMREQADLAWSDFEGLHDDLSRLLEDAVPTLKAEVDAAGVGWTSGRGLPALER
ncbi:MAG: WD40/YVTN/BNR-like repeat-containing protein, partial [Planctomycetota bacterium]